jgi:hypothetical protein
LEGLNDSRYLALWGFVDDPDLSSVAVNDDLRLWNRSGDRTPPISTQLTFKG